MAETSTLFSGCSESFYGIHKSHNVHVSRFRESSFAEKIHLSLDPLKWNLSMQEVCVTPVHVLLSAALFLCTFAFNRASHVQIQVEI